MTSQFLQSNARTIGHRRYSLNPAITLAARLKAETAPLHRTAEAKVGLPDSVRTKADYAALLRRLLAFHTSFERTLSDPLWGDKWKRIGITPEDHSRSPALIKDLSDLESRENPHESESPTILYPSFAQALGGLYVIEGSSLGGKVLTPLFRALLGEIPTHFFEGYGRGDPEPWRSVQAALNRFQEDAGDADEVVAGAEATFESFGNFLAAPRWQSSGAIHP